MYRQTQVPLPGTFPHVPIHPFPNCRLGFPGELPPHPMASYFAMGMPPRYPALQEPCEFRRLGPYGAEALDLCTPRACPPYPDYATNNYPGNMHPCQVSHTCPGPATVDYSRVQASAVLGGDPALSLAPNTPDPAVAFQPVAAKPAVSLVMMVGGPGMGKTTCFENLMERIKDGVSYKLSSDLRFKLFKRNGDGNVEVSYDVKLVRKTDGTFDIKFSGEHAENNNLKGLTAKLVFVREENPGTVWTYDGTNKPYGTEVQGVPTELKTALEEAILYKGHKQRPVDVTYNGSERLETELGSYIKIKKRSYWKANQDHWIHQVLHNGEPSQYSLRKLNGTEFNQLLSTELHDIFQKGLPGNTYFFVDKCMAGNNLFGTLDAIEKTYEGFSAAINLDICICVPKNITKTKKDSGNFFSQELEKECIKRVITRDILHPNLGAKQTSEANKEPEQNLIRFVVEGFSRGCNHSRAWNHHKKVAQDQTSGTRLPARTVISEDVQSRNGKNTGIFFRDIEIDITRGEVETASDILKSIRHSKAGMVDAGNDLPAEATQSTHTKSPATTRQNRSVFNTNAVAFTPTVESNGSTRKGKSSEPNSGLRLHHEVHP